MPSHLQLNLCHSQVFYVYFPASPTTRHTHTHTHFNQNTQNTRKTYIRKRGFIAAEKYYNFIVAHSPLCRNLFSLYILNLGTKCPSTMEFNLMINTHTLTCVHLNRKRWICLSLKIIAWNKWAQVSGPSVLIKKINKINIFICVLFSPFACDTGKRMRTRKMCSINYDRLHETT